MRVSKIRKLFILTILIIIAVGVIYNLFFKGTERFQLFKKQKDLAQETAPASQQQKEQAVPVKAFVVAKKDFDDYHNNFGTLKGGLEFKLSSEFPGIIEKINYKEGEKYRKGALLISLNRDDILLRLRRSESKLNQALINEDIAKNKFEEHKKLFEMGAIPETTLKKAELEYQAIKYEREGVEFVVRQEESYLEKSNIYAPSDGMIGELNVEEGEAVTSNTLLGTHLLTEYVRAEFGVIEQEVSRISRGQTAIVSVDAYPDREFNGIVERVSPIVTGTSRTANTEVKIPNVEGFLLPGMSVRIRILLFFKKGAILVPTEAVIDSENGKAVYVINETDKTLTLRPVSVEYAQSDFSVIASGLTKDELIAISSLDKLSPQSQVDIVEKQEL
jgi:membrane fusion protein, multidrug efflux system